MQTASTEILSRRAAPGLLLSRPTATTAATVVLQNALVPSRSVDIGLFSGELITVDDVRIKTGLHTKNPRSPLGSGGAALQRHRSISLDEGLAGFMGGALQTGKLWSQSLADGHSQRTNSHELPPDPLFPDDNDYIFEPRNTAPSEEDEIRSCMKKGALVPDRTIVNLLARKMEEVSAKASATRMPAGWLLDGFPRNAKQVDTLAHMQRLPDIVVHIDAAEEDILTRILDRRMDPMTGETYNLRTNPPPKEILHRLEKRPDDDLETVAQRLATWNSNWPSINAAFEAHGVPVISVSALSTDSIQQVYQKVRKVMLQCSRTPGLAAGSNARPLNFAFTGAPGSGKGTQCELASADFGLCHLSTGQLLRDVTVQSPTSIATVDKPQRLLRHFTNHGLASPIALPMRRLGRH